MTLSDIEYKHDWTYKDWQEELLGWRHWELLDAYAKISGYNPAVWDSPERNARSMLTYRMARDAIRVEILERMSHSEEEL